MAAESTIPFQCGHLGSEAFTHSRGQMGSWLEWDRGSAAGVCPSGQPHLIPLPSFPFFNRTRTGGSAILAFFLEAARQMCSFRMLCQSTRGKTLVLDMRLSMHTWPTASLRSGDPAEGAAEGILEVANLSLPDPQRSQLPDVSWEIQLF